MRRFVIIMAAALCLVSCQSKHEKLQREIQQRRSALEHHQDSALEASQKEVERLDKELQKVNAEYNKMKTAAEAAHAAGTATAEQLTRTTQMRMHRDSLQVQFDVMCAKIKYINKRKQQHQEGLVPRNMHK
ncbi:MAG: hypothetical protein IJ562_01820 [Prevotella sp.]|nr:hypothetical protein [Prevotella sp.]